MPPRHDDTLSMRERQIMDAVYRLERATVAEIRDKLPDPPTGNAVRTMLGHLVEKGLLRKSFRGKAAVYRAALSKDRARREALQRVLDIFHRGSLASALSVHLADTRAKLSNDEIEQIKALLEQHAKDKS
ncbi:MAG: BlaI/MecI/CopY family transcriptional regulator [Phycisphaerales bacterium]|nr:BlaI/MecI/CopY family transcriptional regulator [Phycisphaerales bacterium]